MLLMKSHLRVDRQDQLLSLTLPLGMATRKIDPHAAVARSKATSLRVMPKVRSTIAPACNRKLWGELAVLRAICWT